MFTSAAASSSRGTTSWRPVIAAHRSAVQPWLFAALTSACLASKCSTAWTRSLREATCSAVLPRLSAASTLAMASNKICIRCEFPFLAANNNECHPNTSSRSFTKIAIFLLSLRISETTPTLMTSSCKEASSSLPASLSLATAGSFDFLSSFLLLCDGEARIDDVGDQSDPVADIEPASLAAPAVGLPIIIVGSTFRFTRSGRWVPILPEAGCTALCSSTSDSSRPPGASSTGGRKPREVLSCCVFLELFAGIRLTHLQQNASPSARTNKHTHACVLSDLLAPSQIPCPVPILICHAP
mmetsp:Transcript_11309/g.21415  ORF Transcript_11309/g.21415 Transcript_11309/m.21415 type:complete len:298 (+) Transcript_11309:2441-3334(+)